METTGIVRRIDELGRIVIPKEIRRTMRIREGEELEILMGQGELVFRKFSAIKNIENFAEPVARALAEATGGTVAVCDNDTVVSVSGAHKKRLTDRAISDKAGAAAALRAVKTYAGAERFSVTADGEDVSDKICVAPVVAGGDLYGSIVLFTDGEKDFMPQVALSAKFLEAACV
ncbi:MAG: AbrB/MazE/SpoVT family DNA-binding domain-containing protein [Clostridiaceae bacterium]|jgi:AbrB family transcriptional regulator (stage V sporulation protein T)|nr:AbrB/MazE/SpoVT family DNA-binding domain-containing protein [Clostridiaceae bacterium]